MLGRLGGVLGEPYERVKRAGSEKPNPRQGSQIGALGETKWKSALQVKSRILDRGRSFEPREGMKSYCEEAKKPIF